jgi:hypothetical protein
MSLENDPSTSITISWRQDGIEPGVVEYGETTSYGWSAQGSSGEIQHVKLAGLKPTTLYHFRCGSGGNWSDDRTFTTAPSDTATPFSFAAVGDSRTHMNVWNDVSSAVAQANPSFCIHSGDLVESGEIQAQWNRWFDAGEPLLSSMVMMPCIGNHESNAHEYFEQFALPGNEQWYSFDYGNAHFVALTTENWLEGPQLEWLERDLASSTATWKFVFFHRPMYSVGSHGSSHDVQRCWGEVFDRYHVDMAFSGHDHLYVRTHPVSGGETMNSSDEGPIYVVTAGAGAPLHGVEDSDQEWLAYARSVHHYSLITIDGNRLTLEARTLDHVAFDTLELEKRLFPDLRVQELNMTPRLPQPGSMTDISVEVGNWGHAASGGTSLVIRCNGDIVGSAEISSLEPGVDTWVNMPWVPDEGAHNISVEVDPDNQVDEGILEWNNAASTSVVVSSPKPDLIPVNFRVVEGRILLGERSDLSFVVRNAGSAVSGPFDYSLSAGADEFKGTHAGLSPGQETRISMKGVGFAPGDWELVFSVNPKDTEDLDDSNNVLAHEVSVRDYVEESGAYYPRGAVEGEPILILYDDTEGSLPEGSEACSIIWGVNDWSRADVRPQGTTYMCDLLETPMSKGLGGLWQIEIPTTEHVSEVNFRFRNGQLVGDVVDDNGGSDWMAPTRRFAVGKTEDLLHAIEEAEAYGGEVSWYRSVLTDANTSIGNGDYVGASSIVGNSTLVLRERTLSDLHQVVESSYQEAVQEGIEVPRAQILLDAAEEAIQDGNFEASRGYLETVDRMIQDARESVPQSVSYFVLLLLFLLPWFMFERQGKSKLKGG